MTATARTGVTSRRTPDDFVLIPGGPFTMGLDAVRSDGRPATTAPQHSVDVDAFRMCRRPISVADFAAFVEDASYVTTAERVGKSWVWLGGENITQPGQDHLWVQIEGATWDHPRGPHSSVDAKLDHPVTHISFWDCVEYSTWSATRLPTEAEWEKSARGTDGRRYTWGDEPPTTDVCNHTMHVGDTTPIGAYPQSRGPFGLDDMAGNVWEWTSTPWHRYPYGRNDARVITTPRGRFGLGVMRGGSFFNDCNPSCLVVADRVYVMLDYTSYDLGARVCLDS